MNRRPAHPVLAAGRESAVIDVSNFHTLDDAAKEFVERRDEHLLKAEAQAGASHSGTKLAARHGRSAFGRLADVARPRRRV